jgi:hypothetical protein
MKMQDKVFNGPLKLDVSEARLLYEYCRKHYPWMVNEDGFAHGAFKRAFRFLVLKAMAQDNEEAAVRFKWLLESYGAADNEQHG